MRVQFSINGNKLYFYGAEIDKLRLDSTESVTFHFPVIDEEYNSSGYVRLKQEGILKKYEITDSEVTVPASDLHATRLYVSAYCDLYSTNEVDLEVEINYTGDEVSTVVNKTVFLNENQINIYNEDRSQYINFIMPRYYDGIDLSQKTCRVHWYSPDNDVADYDAVEDLEAVDNNITFTWLVKNSLTQYVGEIQFVIEFIGEDYVWKTKTCSFEVLESLSDTGGLTPTPTNQWYQEFVLEMEGLVGALVTEYSSEETYEVGQYVMYNHVVYRCTTEISTAESWNPDHWTQVVLTEDIATRVEGRTLYI